MIIACWMVTVGGSQLSQGKNYGSGGKRTGNTLTAPSVVDMRQAKLLRLFFRVRKLKKSDDQARYERR